MSRTIRVTTILAWMALASVGCGDPSRSRVDAGPRDGAATDSDVPTDAALPDSGDAGVDSGSEDSGFGDSGFGDSGFGDSGFGDSGSGDSGAADSGAADSGAADSGAADSGAADSGAADSGAADAGTGTGGCISGATGTHVLRFRWNGTTSGSTAWVGHEANTLPDTSRWRVTAASRSIGYTPVFRDPFLGEGGLDLSGTVFIDVELSTAGLSRLSNVTLAIYGRSFNTTTSGSFQWQTFSGTGASPSGGVANSAPYEWYGADATAALPAGDDSVLLRIRAAGPSNALIVNQVEVCFDAS